MAISTYISTITLNVNGLNAPIKRHRVAEWIQEQDPYICCLQETHLRSKDTHRLKVRGWKKVFHENGNKKQTGVTISVLDKIDFKTQTVIRDKEGHYIMIKESIQEEGIMILNIFVPNIGPPKYIKQILTDIKGEIDSNTAGDFNNPLSSMDRSSRQKINKEKLALNDTLYQMNLIDIYKTFHPKAAEYTFFSSA